MTFLFDLDGTLIDTEKFYRIAWPEAMSHFGYSFTQEDYLPIRSLGRPFIIDYFKNFTGDDQFDYQKVRDYRKQVFRKLEETYGIDLKPGVVELLQYLKAKGIDTAVVTATEEQQARAYLKELGILDYFDYVISASEVPCGKPDPAVYRMAAGTLGKLPEECVAVEDSPNGIRSAHGSGMKVIMVPDLSGYEALEESVQSMVWKVVPSLTHIMDLV